MRPFPGVSGQDATGTPTMHISIVLQLRPALLQAMTERDEPLSDLGNRMSSAITIDAEDVVIVSMSSETFLESKPSTGFPDVEKFYPLIERLLKKQLGEGDEPWKDVGDEPV